MFFVAAWPGGEINRMFTFEQATDQTRPSTSAIE